MKPSKPFDPEALKESANSLNALLANIRQVEKNAALASKILRKYGFTGPDGTVDIMPKIAIYTNDIFGEKVSDIKNIPEKQLKDQALSFINEALDLINKEIPNITFYVVGGDVNLDKSRVEVTFRMAF